MRSQILILMVGCLQIVHGQHYSFSEWYRDDLMNDAVATSGYRPNITTVRSIHDCGAICGQDVTCLSFFYVSRTKFCQLQDVVLNTTTGLIYEMTSKYFIRVKVQHPTFTCPEDDTEYRTVVLSDASLFTYKVIVTPLVTHAVALANCIADGAHLVRVTSSAKMDILMNLTNSCGGYSQLDYWVDLSNAGATDYSDINQWVSSIGEPLPDGNDFWDPSQPNTPSADHCVVLWRIFNYKLCDRHCSSFSYAYICEKDL